MPRVLGIDTSNYTTSVAVVENGCVTFNSRKMLEVKQGKRGLRQSEAFFQHVNNLPLLFNIPDSKNIDGICVSTRPRSVEGSYMPVFKAGEAFATTIGRVLDVPVFYCSHQEGHIAAASKSIGMKEDCFIAFHISGGTSEILIVNKQKQYNIKKIGGTQDISFGQFIDRLGVASGLLFPSGKYMDSLALGCRKMHERIPSSVKGLSFNMSGQESCGLRYIKDGYNQEEIAYISMMCVCKTLEKLIKNIWENYSYPILITGGVACSSFIKDYLSNCINDNRLRFSQPEYAGDNAAGAAYIGYEKYTGEI